MHYFENMRKEAFIRGYKNAEKLIKDPVKCNVEVVLEKILLEQSGWNKKKSKVETFSTIVGYLPTLIIFILFLFLMWNSL